MTTPMNPQEYKEPKLMYSDLSGKYYFVTKFYKDGRAKEKVDVTQQILHLIEKAKVEELRKLDESTIANESLKKMQIRIKGRLATLRNQTGENDG